MNIWMCYCCVDFKRREHSNKRDTQKEKWRISSIVNNGDDDDDDTKTTHVGQKTRMCACAFALEHERQRAYEEEKGEEKTGQLPFQSSVSKRLLSRFLFVCGYFASKEREKERKDTAVTTTSELNWITCPYVCVSMIMLRKKSNRCSSRQAPSFIRARTATIECRIQVKWPD